MSECVVCDVHGCAFVGCQVVDTDFRFPMWFLLQIVGKR